MQKEFKNRNDQHFDHYRKQKQKWTKQNGGKNQEIELLIKPWVKKTIYGKRLLFCMIKFN